MARVALLLLALLPFAGLARAQPLSAPQAQHVEAAPPLVQLRASLGVGRYSESGEDFTFIADIEPILRIDGEGALAIGRGHLALQLAAALGTEVDITATRRGIVTQRNRFRQHLYEASPRIRWPLTRALDVDAGYRLTLQRLFITELPMVSDVLETVTVHALEAGIAWHRTGENGGRLQAEVILGLNRGSAENDQLEGEDFTAFGLSLSAHVYKRSQSGVLVGGCFDWREQSGSDTDTVKFQGMDRIANWPENVTWQLLAIVGYALR